MVAYQEALLLFGGIDYSSEQVFNDLFVLDTKTWHWRSIEQRGSSISPRNSHALHTLSVDSTHYLVIFGGADQNVGPKDDCFVALLPPLLKGTVHHNDISIKIMQ